MRIGRFAGLGSAVALSSAFGALALVLCGRTLDPAAFSQYSAYWGSLFLVGASVSVFEQEASRAVATGERDGTRWGSEVTRVLLLAALVALAAAGAIAVAGMADGWRDVGGDPARAGLVALAGIGFAIQNTMYGCFIGAGRSHAYAALTAAEGAIRFGAICVALVSPSVSHMALATVAGSFAWVLFVPTILRHWMGEGPVPRTADLVRRCGTIAVLGASSAALVTGYPALAAGLLPARSSAVLGGLLATLAVTRVPLLAAAPAQALLIPHIVVTGSRRPPRHTVTAAAALTVTAALGAAWLGPGLVRVVFGGSYRVGALASAGLAASAIGIAGLTLVSAALIAVDRHGWAANAWLTALLVAAGCLATIRPAATAVVCSLLGGSATGLVLAAIAYARPAGRGSNHFVPAGTTVV